MVYLCLLKLFTSSSVVILCLFVAVYVSLCILMFLLVILRVFLISLSDLFLNARPGVRVRVQCLVTIHTIPADVNSYIDN